MLCIRANKATFDFDFDSSNSGSLVLLILLSYIAWRQINLIDLCLILCGVMGWGGGGVAVFHLRTHCTCTLPHLQYFMAHNGSRTPGWKITLVQISISQIIHRCLLYIERESCRLLNYTCTLITGPLEEGFSTASMTNVTVRKMEPP